MTADILHLPAWRGLCDAAQANDYDLQLIAGTDSLAVTAHHRSIGADFTPWRARFVSDRKLCHGSSYGNPGSALAMPLGEYDESVWRPGYKDNTNLVTQLRRRRCVRAKPYSFRDLAEERKAELFIEFYKRNAGKQATRDTHGNWVCPHRSIPLAGIAPGEDGLIECPLHGLKICSRTGIVEPGLVAPAQEKQP